MTDYREELHELVRRRLDDRSTPAAERAALLAALEQNAVPPPSGHPAEQDEVDWSFVDRWPTEVRLGVLRVLDELGVIDRLRSVRPLVYGALVERLKA